MIEVHSADIMATVIKLKEEVEGVALAIRQAEEARVVAEREKAEAQEQVTDLIAKFEQNKSLLRSVESQVEDK